MSWQDESKAESVINRMMTDWTGSGFRHSSELHLLCEWLSLNFTGETRHRSVLSILCEMGNQGLSGTAGFEVVVASLTPMPVEEHVFIVPLKVGFSGQIALPVRKMVGGSWIQISTRAALNRRWLMCLTDADAESAYVLKGRGATVRAAWHSVQTSFETFRGILEFCYGVGGQSIGTLPRARHRFPIGTKIRHIKSGRLELITLLSDEGERARVPVERGVRWADVLRLCSLLRAPPHAGSFNELICNCMRLYQQALDETLPHRAFLSLWQLAEEMAVGEAINGDTRKIAARLAPFLHTQRMDVNMYQQLLAKCGRKRCELVHHGNYTVDDQDVNMLKLMCDRTLIALLNMHQEFPDRASLDEFYRLSAKNDAELTRIAHAASLVRNQREAWR